MDLRLTIRASHKENAIEVILADEKSLGVISATEVGLPDGSVPADILTINVETQGDFGVRRQSIVFNRDISIEVRRRPDSENQE